MEICDIIARARELSGNGHTKGPWETFHDTWEDYSPDGEVIAEYEQFGIIGGYDGILEAHPRETIMEAPNQWSESGEHDNMANMHVAAFAPDAVAALAEETYEYAVVYEELMYKKYIPPSKTAGRPWAGDKWVRCDPYWVERQTSWGDLDEAERLMGVHADGINVRGPYIVRRRVSPPEVME